MGIVPQVMVTVLTALLLPSLAAAQSASGGITGVARDTSGGVLPGVTVEAARLRPTLLLGGRLFTRGTQVDW